jgi:D-sedoheptulose 7-phosphate isomerase
METLNEEILKYKKNLKEFLDKIDPIKILKLVNEIEIVWKNSSNIFICGNGGSAGNANHIANDFLYGVGKTNGIGVKIESLSANPAVITCLANDTGYENIFSEQIKVKGKEGDLLIVLSGSGNSKNIINALNIANEKKLRTFSILGFDGGKCKEISQQFIHSEINDMQISEDLQLSVMHMCMQILSKKKI